VKNVAHQDWLRKPQQVRPRRRPVKISGAEYESPDNGSSRVMERFYFFTKVNEYAPEVLETLFEEPLALYKQLAQQLAATGSDDALCPPFDRYEDRDDWGPELAPLRDCLLRWGRRWGMDANWCLVIAFMTLWEQNLPPDERSSSWGWCLAFGLDYVDPFADQDLRLTFEYAGWNPLEDTRDDTRKTILDTFTCHLDAYLDGLERQAQEAGFVPAREFRALEHLDWLVLHQVKGMPFSAIARHASQSSKPISRQGVTTAVKSHAALLGLPLRADSSAS